VKIMAVHPGEEGINVIASTEHSKNNLMGKQI